MMDKHSFTIVGTGAVGGYYGALLQKAGHSVRFLLRSDAEYVKKHGLKIESCNGDFDLPTVEAYSDAQDVPPSDVIIISLKTTANAVLPEGLPPLLKETSLVLTLQNGLGSEAEMARIVGTDRVLGGLCFLCANKVGPGHIRHLDYGLITLGEYRSNGAPGGRTPRLESVGNALSEAGIPIRLEDDLALARWKKLVWNIPFNGMAALHRSLTDELLKQPELRQRCLTMMHEVAAAAAACCRPIEEEFILKMMDDTEKMRPYAPSMKLDFDQGRPMEIESIYGVPVRTALEHGVEMPETEKLYNELLKLELGVLLKK